MVVSPHVDPSIRLTENLGQWNEPILFRAQLDGGACFLEKNGLTFSFYDKKKYRAIHHGGILKNTVKDFNIGFHAYKMIFENSNPSPVVEKMQEGKDYENFFLGSDHTKWKCNVRNYHQVFLRNVYNGIDYEVFTTTKGLKYNFRVQPNADPSKIRVRYEGVKNIRLNEGALVIKLEVSEVVEQKPYAYQVINGETREVKCSYNFKNNVLSFEFPEGFDNRYELVIDPILVFAAQSGSSADNFGMTATYDTQGNLYAGGTCFNNGYPTTPGAFSVSFTGFANNVNTDVVITKYNSTGTTLLYSTYMGGSSSEIVSSMIVDINDNLCFYGATGSSNFPMVAGAYDNTFAGGPNLAFVFNGTTFNAGTDIYVAKLNSAGTTLLGATYLGGTDNDGVNHVNHTTILGSGTNTLVEFFVDSLQNNYGDQYRGEIQLDVLNNIYIASSTRSSDFPTVNAYDNTLGGKQDAIVAKLNSNLTQLLYSTYLGGSLNDCGNALIVNDQLEVFVTGGTCSSNFPTTTGAQSTTYNGGKTDGFIVHLNSAGNGILHSTFVGTNSYDQCYFIQSDKYANIFVYGQSLGNMPVVNVTVSTSSVIVPYHNPGTHQFITRYRPDLSAKNMSMVFGSKTNNTDISPCAFAVDKCNNIYVSGWGGDILSNNPASVAMNNMPLFQPTQSSTDGFDFYFMGLDSNAQALKYGSYFGGQFSDEHVDGGTSRFDPGGRIYQSACAGCGGNDDWPVTPGAWPGTFGNPNHSSNCNNGVVKLDFQLQMAVATINTNTLGGCAPLTVNFTNATPPPGSGATYTWNLGNGVVTSNTINPSVTYTAGGTYTVSLTVEDNLTCNKTDKTVTYVTVLPKPSSNLNVVGGQCTNTVSFSQNTSGGTGPYTYLWNFGDGAPTTTVTAPSYTYPGNGIYDVTLTVTDAKGCKDIITNTVGILNFSPGAVSESTLCYGSVTTLTASGGNNYTWTPAGSLDNPNVAVPQASPTITTIYTVDILNNTLGYNCGKTLTTQIQVLPTPTTSFAYTVNPCGGNLWLNDQSIDDIIRWQWALGASKTSTAQ
ncbi:MAG: PKD domain-containing protein, partial [Bacteroidia bacterium]|nr:PKD domain-containing protein [Bacteroidia bacterium]